MVQPLPVVYEHQDFFIFSKPAGMSFHSESGEGFVVAASKQAAMPLFSVHRLDKMTSGLLILAKSAQAAATLSGLFESRQIQKYYLAISLRKPKKKQGWIKGDMAASRRGSYKLLNTRENPAVTHFISTALRVHERLFLVRPYTGKTHQIRVALKSLGSPVAGDERYANKEEARHEDRGYLHAFALCFDYEGIRVEIVDMPSAGERFLSETCQKQLQGWCEPWKLL